MSKLLPVGSIVKLKKDQERKVDLMVLGYYPVKADENQCYEYLGVIYPGGTAKDAPMFMFNGGDIDEVRFEGYSTEETQKALDALTKHTLDILAASNAAAAPAEPEKNEDLFF